MRVFSVPGIVLGFRETAVSKRDKVPAHRKFSIKDGGSIDNKHGIKQINKILLSANRCSEEDKIGYMIKSDEAGALWLLWF